MKYAKLNGEVFLKNNSKWVGKFKLCLINWTNGLFLVTFSLSAMGKLVMPLCSQYVTDMSVPWMKEHPLYLNWLLYKNRESEKEDGLREKEKVGEEEEVGTSDSDQKDRRLLEAEQKSWVPSSLICCCVFGLQICIKLRKSSRVS